VRFRSLLLLIFTLPLLAGERVPLTFDAVYDPRGELAAASRSLSTQWIGETRVGWAELEGETNVARWRVYDVATKRESVLFEAATLEAALRNAGIEAAAAKTAARQSTLSFDAKGDRALIRAGGDLVLFTPASGAVRRLTRTPVDEKVPSFSPDGASVAFVRDNDLWVLELASGDERRLTDDGSDVILNGILDWVYQEEIYGRGDFKGYWWSPDSGAIAALRLDESPVPFFTVVDHIPYHLELETYRYPKAGDPNPLPQLRIVSTDGGSGVQADLGAWTPTDLLIAGVSWKPDSSAVAVQLQNRTQTWLDLAIVERGSGKATRLLRETTPAWVDNLGAPEWLGDGGFLWLSERSGWTHIYRYPASGENPTALTEGSWDVESLHGVDEKEGFVYFSSAERNRIGADVYRARLDGSGRELLTRREGTNTARFSPSSRYFIHNGSDAVTPTEVRVRAADGSELRQLPVPRLEALERYILPAPEFLRVKARDGFELDAMLIKPPDFAPSKKYPVLQQLYAGPEAPLVRNAWRGATTLFYQLAASKGYIVWICDNRTASSHGAASAWPLRGRLGALELRDLEDGLAWLKAQPWVDGERIAANGWSYGGFMVSYALTHSDQFAAGIAGGSVTDWRDYDSIYTERFLGLPQDNPDGYRESSPRFAAANLKGKLLLIHGTMDENVHMQNTLQFARELQLADKPFELMLYPKTRHGVREAALRRHMNRLIFDFLDRTIGAASRESGVGSQESAP
jgi:dipeptidyl-peptidase-4